MRNSIFTIHNDIGCDDYYIDPSIKKCDWTDSYDIYTYGGSD